MTVVVDVGIDNVDHHLFELGDGIPYALLIAIVDLDMLIDGCPLAPCQKFFQIRIGIRVNDPFILFQ